MSHICDLCGSRYEMAGGKGARRRVTCYECTAGRTDRVAICRNTHLKKKYGLTSFQVRKLIDSQGRACKICGSSIMLTGTKNHKGVKKGDSDPHIDHCHATGKVRGILCFQCNAALGLAGDDPAVLFQMADYLMDHQAQSHT